MIYFLSGGNLIPTGVRFITDESRSFDANCYVVTTTRLSTVDGAGLAGAGSNRERHRRESSGLG